MKQLWTLLIAVSCSLTAYSQQHKTDSTHPKQSSGQQADTKDSGRAAKAISTPKPPARSIDTTKAASGQSISDTGIKKTSQHSALSDSAKKVDSSRHNKAAATGPVAGRAKKDAPPPVKLSPEQLVALKQRQQAERLKAKKDSIYKAHRYAIRKQLATQALARTGNMPDYDLYFPQYFYQNNNSIAANGALVNIHAYPNRDKLFYAFIGITFLLGLIKVVFPRYFNQVFWFFLHPNDRKNNVSDQIRGQNILPSLLLNLFFVLTGGLFLTQIIRIGLPGANFWTSWLVFSGLLTIVYLVKYLVILLSGWIFGAPTAATIYNQVVFSINKIIGLVLLPATLLISYGSAQATSHVFTTVLVIISILLIYRYIASFLLIKGKLKVSAFHFILYLCAVEIIPLLLVYKVLLTNIGRFV